MGSDKPISKAGKPYSKHLKPFKPGQSGNPKGRKTVGANVKEWLNVLGEKGLTATALMKIVKDKKERFTKRAAARQALQMCEYPDLADMTELIEGTMNLKELRKSGINTAVIKKVKHRERLIPNGDGEPEREVEREVELHDRAGEAFDRVMDRTDGKPAQSVDVTSKGEQIKTALLVRDGTLYEEL